MFTGIINCLGKVSRKTATTLVIEAEIKKQKIGASIAINGVCLTLSKTKNDGYSFDVGPDTWRRTNLRALTLGQCVNVETSLRLGDEIGGHFVSGHVDAAADILSLKSWGEGFRRLRVKLPGTLRGLVAVKGSIAIDGVSLTVTSASRHYFEVMLVPHTLQNTTLGSCRAYAQVNLEADPLARYALAAASALMEAAAK